MRVVVTGAAGFVGSALVDRLRRDGHDVVATDVAVDGGVAGDLTDPALLATLFAEPVDAVVHLATVPGGAAEAGPDRAWDVNVAASRALVAAAAPHTPRFLFASSIAVFGDPLPREVDDGTPIAPRLLYGAHKAMIEEWVAAQSRRGAIDGLSLRLPGIVARPRGPSGMISAFMSDLFHAARDGEPIALPVSADATMWLLSRPALVEALVSALTLADLPGDRRITMAAQRVRMGDLVAALGHASFVTYRPDPAVEAAFGRLPPLTTARADALGLRHDGSLEALVAAVFADPDRKEIA